MTTVLLIQSPDPAAPALAADLRAAGFTLQDSMEPVHLVREAVRGSPDVLVCWVARPDAAFFTALRTLQAQQALPVLVFTQDAGVEAMTQALEAGVHAWVVQGYAPQRLRPLVHLAQARAAHEARLRGTLADLSERFEERKLVDQAKGLLMRASRVSEEEAFGLLRTASMHGNQRVGQVSRQVIDAARTAEAINRAGQQRMLSQRLVKLYALACSQTDAPAALALLRQSVQRVDENLKALDKGLSDATYGDLLRATRAGWEGLRTTLEQAPVLQQLAALDSQAEAMRLQADALVLALEGSGQATTVHVVNVAGRQRMLSQRVAKQALLGVTGALLQESIVAVEEGLASLAAAPLSTGEIRELLAAAQQAWAALRTALPRAGDTAGRRKLAAASEELLALFERLTAAYQHSVQVLLG
ncbi:type IV pili methyl-accepting chemotaxis transducer N-terminal domain-containing protein [uncultured Ramlibacter sp.]|uniref:type IV pili methyl-accepting chemotaxis transducer N-terminal domain-containing protein n=1 Tax=uncultured Ramlibacter sp. TaxID=260755 RepID=UPI00260A07C8|nr:type IV pili methyl-accepting chemotaxis transducer N-terminal domain-containing protein [uncultured Ramlibacter sp.]